MEGTIYEQEKRLYTHRVTCRNRYYRTFDGYIITNTRTGKKTGKDSRVSGSAQTMGYDMVNVL